MGAFLVIAEIFKLHINHAEVLNIFSQSAFSLDLSVQHSEKERRRYVSSILLQSISGLQYNLERLLF